MSKLNVDLDKLNEAKNEINHYKEYVKDRTNFANDIVTNMNQCWRGTDYEQFENEWEQLIGENSITTRANKKLESYKSYLNRCYTEYNSLQEELKAEATKLPQY